MRPKTVAVEVIVTCLAGRAQGRAGAGNTAGRDAFGRRLALLLTSLSVSRPTSTPKYCRTVARMARLKGRERTRRRGGDCAEQTWCMAGTESTVRPHLQADGAELLSYS